MSPRHWTEAIPITLKQVQLALSSGIDWSPEQIKQKCSEWQWPPRWQPHSQSVDSCTHKKKMQLDWLGAQMEPDIGYSGREDRE
ncbi:hypothetical protein ACLKA6_010859 [Drosophila palustris]